jgi:hypothetical protein
LAKLCKEYLDQIDKAFSKNEELVNTLEGQNLKKKIKETIDVCIEAEHRGDVPAFN